MKETIIDLLAILALGAAAVFVACTVGVAKIGEQEAQAADQQMEDDRFSAAYWDEHDTSGLIEED